ncbi:transcription factor [Ganoderma sinense ZZ0214-1]|uniref:Transcription factor n=1 Tax=Ganoderma sinense ZZ0214-1 TaxID=1077348 RepID=A0A2G8SR14_9APHY|nr:transcription factor [Ganoderma sinense ZZ0214-1]
MGQSQMPQHHIPMTPASQVRSPTGPYQTSFATPYPQHQPNAYGFPAGPDPRHLPPPLQMNPYDQPSSLGGRRGSLVERSNPLRTSGHGASPYPRVASAIPHVPEPPVEPVKKKRKRADAEQLKVLNETYSRTAFPSTEERIELAKKLGMSARSVQICQTDDAAHLARRACRFQNKRQAMRQSSRQAAASAPPTTSQPYATPSHSSSATPAAPTPQPAGYPGSLTGASSASQAGYGTTRPSSGMGRLNTSPSPSSHRRSHEDDPHRHDGRRFSPPRPF